MNGSPRPQAQRQGRPKFGGAGSSRIFTSASSWAVNGPCLVAGPKARACAADPFACGHRRRERRRNLAMGKTLQKRDKAIRNCSDNQGHGSVTAETMAQSLLWHGRADTAKTRHQHGIVAQTATIRSDTGTARQSLARTRQALESNIVACIANARHGHTEYSARYGKLLQDGGARK